MSRVAVLAPALTWMADADKRFTYVNTAWMAWLRRHDGEYLWILDSGIPLLAPDGSSTGYVGIRRRSHSS